MKRCIDSKPEKPGEYCIAIDGVMTFMPIFMKFDGEEWDWSAIDGYGLVLQSEVWWFPE